MPTPTGYTSAYTSTEIDAKLGAVDGKADKIAEVNHGTSDTTFTLTPNVMHIWGTVASLNLSLPTDSNSTLDEYLFTFTSGSTPTTLTLPASIKWIQDPEFEENKTYQISIVNGLAGFLTNGMVAGSGGGGGENNVIESISVNGVAQTVSNKNVDLLFKTINNTPIEGSGNISIQGGGDAIFIQDIDCSNLVDGTKTISDSSIYTAINTAYQAGKAVYVKWSNSTQFPEPIMPLINASNGAFEFTFSLIAPPINSAILFDVMVYTTHVDISYIGGGYYTKPSGGIPSTDLASAVQTSLGKADTAMQAFIYDIDASNLDEYGEKIVESSTPYTAIHAAYQAGKTIYVRLTNDVSFPFILNMVSTNGLTESGYEFTAIVQNGAATYTAHVDIGASEYYIECHQKFFLEEEEDPTVPSWAKQATKPTYTAQEVGALPSSTTIPSALSQLSDDSTHRVVTDSEKSTWNSKGTYSKPSGGIPASDIASGVIPTVPTNVSAFTNDANYVSSTNTVAIYSGSSAPSSSTGKNGDIYIQTS